MSRPSKMDDPDLRKTFAEAWVQGATREELAHIFGVSPNSLYTITLWSRDPRVKAIAATIAQDRMLNIVRKTDSSLQARLRNADELSVRELLDIRKEFAPRTAKAGETGGHPATETETTEALEDNPELADELERLIENAEASEDAE